MSDRNLKRLAWSIAISAVLLIAASAFFVYRNAGPEYAYWGSGVGFGFSYPLIGALIISRLPRHRMGWLFCATAIWALDAFAGAYGAYALAQQPALPLGIWLAWLSRWLWLPGALSIGLIALLFPTGRPLSRRWNVAIWTTVVGTVMFCIGVALFPGQPPFPNIQISFDSPVGLADAESFLLALDNIGRALFSLIIPTAVFSLILRLRRSRGQERQQLKWFVFAAVVSLPFFPLAGPLGLTFSLIGIVIVGTIVSALMPIAAGIAILRYHLYDIDVIIRRTLIYSVLTGLLAFIYYASAVLLERLFRLLTGQQQSDAVIVVSTLIIFALFAPLYRRIREAIDSRFYRRKYDAQQVLMGFGQKVRDQVELDTLLDQLQAVVEETMQPENVSVWLKTPVTGSNTKRTI